MTTCNENVSGLNGITRRRLLGRGARWMAGAAAAPYMLTSAALGAPGRASASNRITLGHIGVGGMGSGHLGLFLGDSDVQIVGVADVNRGQRDKALAAVKDRYGQACAGYNDFRELLDREDVDAVCIATPDHWHALIGIAACDAGKDVYCEKPLSLTIREARAMVNAARRNATVFQTGSQQRSSDNFRLACEVVRSGRIGKLRRVEATVGGGLTIDVQPPEPVPDFLDWDFWLGPAPWAEFTPQRCFYNFRWIYEYSGGKMTDWGAHHNDIAQWGLGMSHSGPIKTEPVFAKFPTRGLYDTATHFEVKHTYANGVELYTKSHGRGDVWFEGTNGWVQVGRGSLEASDPDIIHEPLGAGDVHLDQVEGDDIGGHHRNWIDCIKTRRRPICDVEIGARSATVCHLGTIAIRTGRTIHWDPEKEMITNDPTMNRWLHKSYRGPWQLT